MFVQSRVGEFNDLLFSFSSEAFKLFSKLKGERFQSINQSLGYAG